MRDILLTEIAELQAQIDSYAVQLEQLENGSAKYNVIKSEWDKTNAKLAAKQESLNEIDGAAQIAQEELFNQFDNIEVAGIPFSLRDLAKGPDEYQIISAYFQNYVGDMAQQHATVISSYKSQVERLEDEAQELATLRKSNYELSDKLADMELRRDAAADELLQVDEEKKRLAADNESLRKQIESTTKTSHTNFNTNYAEIAKKLHDAKPAIYGKRWEDDLKRTSYIANLAETGEEIVIPRLELGKYRELSEDEASRFREELEVQKAAEVAEAVVQSVSLVAPPIFPFQDGEVQTDSIDREMAQETVGYVTRQEFEELTARVIQLEQQKVAVA